MFSLMIFFGIIEIIGSFFLMLTKSVFIVYFGMSLGLLNIIAGIFTLINRQWSLIISLSVLFINLIGHLVFLIYLMDIGSINVFISGIIGVIVTVFFTIFVYKKRKNNEVRSNVA